MAPIYAILWCPRCWQHTEFCLAPDAAPGDPQPPIECWDCDFRYAPALVTCDSRGVEYEVPYLQYPLSTQILEAGRAEVRLRVRSVVIGSGYPLESLKRTNGRTPS